MNDAPKKRHLEHIEPNAAELTHRLPVFGLERFLALKYAGSLPVQGRDDATKRDTLIRELAGTDWDLDELGGKDFPTEAWRVEHELKLTKPALRYLRDFIDRLYDVGSVTGRQALDLNALRARVAKTLERLE